MFLNSILNIFARRIIYTICFEKMNLLFVTVFDRCSD